MSVPSAAVSTPRKNPSVISTVAGIVLSGLAGGAIWCLLSLLTEYDTTLLIVPLAIGIAAFMRWQRYRGIHGAISAVAATLIAFAYAQYLFAAVRIAQMLGFSLRNTLFKMDFGLAWHAIRANLDVWHVGLLILACALAAWLMLRNPRRVG
ncbi:MAG: hypothetical protein ABI304_12360 [Rudaea sp.]